MTERLEACDTPIPGVKVIKRNRLGDERGYLERIYCRTTMQLYGLDKPVRQINRTLTRQAGAVRGIHYQRPPSAEAKVISCLSGRVFDVAVDLRQGSPTFLHWHAEELSADNDRSLMIPEGCGHAFQTLTTDCMLLYLHTADYSASAESGISARDPRLAIRWPLPIAQQSERDLNLPDLAPMWEGRPV